MPFAHVHLKICDEKPTHTPYVRFYDSHNEALKACAKSAVESVAGDHTRQIFHLLIAHPKKPLWVWRMERHGCGDLYLVRECENTVDATLALLTRLNFFEKQKIDVAKCLDVEKWVVEHGDEECEPDMKKTKH